MVKDTSGFGAIAPARVEPPSDLYGDEPVIHYTVALFTA